MEVYMEYNIDKKISGVYKYVVDDEIYYIGKSESNILDRLFCHEKEEKFKDILPCCSIYYAPMSNKVEICALEKLLINKYKPSLNVVDAGEEGSEYKFDEPEWILCYDADLVTIPTFIKKRGEELDEIFEEVEEYRKEIKDVWLLLDFIKKYRQDETTDIVSIISTDSDHQNKIRFTSPSMYYKGMVLIDSISVEPKNHYFYKYSIKVKLSKCFVDMIKKEGIDELQSKAVEDYFKYAVIEDIKNNMNNMFNKISDSISKNGTWCDLEDAGWTFLRMFDLQKIAYIPECEDMTDHDREFYKNVKVDKEGRICKMGD